MIRILTVASLVLLSAAAHAADMQESAGEGGLLSGGWSLTLGASGYFAPEYEGDDKMVFMAVPLVSLGRTDTITKFSSRNDNISLGLIDNGTFRAGIAGKILFGRDEDDSDDLIGLDPVAVRQNVARRIKAGPTVDELLAGPKRRQRQPRTKQR